MNRPAPLATSALAIAPDPPAGQTLSATIDRTTAVQFTALDAAAASDLMPASSPAQQLATPLVAFVRRPEGSQQLTVRLDPESLGAVQVRIERVANGPARIEVTAERPDTLARLIRDEPELRRTLDQAGIPSASNRMVFTLADPSYPAPARHDPHPSPGLADEPTPTRAGAAESSTDGNGLAGSSFGSGGPDGIVFGDSGPRDGGPRDSSSWDGGASGNGAGGSDRGRHRGDTPDHHRPALRPLPAERWARAGIDITA